ncbi:MAG TPA: beta-propeller domain-containing protein [Streptosporangiaceae bacterium]|nr:beta-propeller domain-containing protein [Streptosporangiaceae bacterium]
MGAAADGSANSARGGQAAAAQANAGSTAAGQAIAAPPGTYSTTNTATAGVDEPDIVKTDGHRIVTITGNVLRVVDAQTGQITGALDLSAGLVNSPAANGPGLVTSGFGALTPANLLLSGDHALVLFNQSPYVFGGPPAGGGAVGPAGSAGSAGSTGSAGSAGPVGPAGTAPQPPILGPRVALIDLSTGTPQIVSEYTMDGSLVDARQVGSVARVIVQSAPRIYFPPMEAPSAQPGLAPERAAIAHAGLNQWLPRYAVTAGGQRVTGVVDCASVSHPAAVAYSGNSMLTVLTFDLSGTTLGNGEPVTIVADGDTVYSDGASLYVASRQWTATPALGTASGPAPANGLAGIPQYTSIYKFDISGPGRPVYEASGTVPGWLLGSAGTAQYSLSSWHGALRVATTTSYAQFVAGTQQPPQSAVYVLEQSGDQLVTVGKVGGLGAGEQIYAVRFVGPVGYVVTFRQVDPLYTIDLSDPAQPRVVGQLELSGYSAYLYPIDATHLIGIGQNANSLGQTTGTQISLFDVSDPAAPVRLAVHDLQFGHSQAEFDPHAFLYWPSSKLLVIPAVVPYGVTPSEPTPVPQGGTFQGSTFQGAAVPYPPPSEAVVLHVGANSFTQLGTITHATSANPYGGQISRSLIVGNALWTLSDAGLKANDIATLAPLAWVPFT